MEVSPRIHKCHNETYNAAEMIKPAKVITISSNFFSVTYLVIILTIKDTEVAITLYKTGYSIPGDYIFEDLNEKNSISTLNNHSSNIDF